MKFWIWGAIATLGAILLSWGVSLRPASEAIELLQVNSQFLRDHLSALASERYTDADLAKTRTYLTRQLNQVGYTVEEQQFDLQGVRGINLIGTRPGNDPAAGTLLVGAHYDSVQGSPGADDNASAIAAALEIARMFAHIPTPTTLKIVFFDREEQQSVGVGLLGSTAFVSEAANLADLKGAVILEMLGYTCDEPGCQRYPNGIELDHRRDTGDFLAAIGDTQHLELLEAFGSVEDSALETESTGSDLPVMTLPVPIGAVIVLPDLFRSDHAPFWFKGIGALMLTDTANFRNPNYHQSSDTVDSLDLVFLTDVTQKVARVLETLLTN